MLRFTGQCIYILMLIQVNVYFSLIFFIINTGQCIFFINLFVINTGQCIFFLIFFIINPVLVLKKYTLTLLMIKRLIKNIH